MTAILPPVDQRPSYGAAETLRQIADRLDSLPAGQDAATAIIGAAVTIFGILLITDILCLTRVFHFTRCVNQ